MWGDQTMILIRRFSRKSGQLKQTHSGILSPYLSILLPRRLGRGDKPRVRCSGRYDWLGCGTAPCSGAGRVIGHKTGACQISEWWDDKICLGVNAS